MWLQELIYYILFDNYFTYFVYHNLGSLCPELFHTACETYNNNIPCLQPSSKERHSCQVRLLTYTHTPLNVNMYIGIFI